MNGSIIGKTTQIRGNVRGTGPVEVEGRVEGDVSTDSSVVLAEGAVVRGNVSGTTLRIAGTVAGDLTASEALLLEPGARVVGDLVAPRIGVAEGALVKGAVRTEGMAAAPRAMSRPSAARRVEPTAKEAPPRAERATPPAKPAERAAASPASSPSAAKRRSRPSKQTAAKPSPTPPAKRFARKPPPPVVPALAKGTRGRKKKAKRK